jgi:hypothetical protein
MVPDRIADDVVVLDQENTHDLFLPALRLGERSMAVSYQTIANVALSGVVAAIENPSIP